LRKATISL